MKKFLVIEEQDGGCDYTIGCGVSTYFISAKSIEAAVEQLKAAAFSEDVSDDEGGGLLATQERERSAARVYEVAEARELPLAVWRKERKAASAAAAAAEQEKSERETLAKLQKKYGSAS